MPSRSDSRSKRPPPLPIKKPSLSYKHEQQQLPSNARSTGYEKQQQYAQHPLDATCRGQKFAGASSVTTPVDPAEIHLPNSGSSRGRHVAELTNLMEQRIASSVHKSDYGSIPGSSHASTTRSRQSARSQQSAAAAQVQLEAFDELSARGEIESRSERSLFKMTGQIPPSPADGDLKENEVYIRVVDLRPQCRAVNDDEQSAQEEAPKSPKKKLFQNLRNAFSKSSSAGASYSSTEVPSLMPLKAAQVLGAAERQPQIIQALPIKPPLPSLPELSWPLPSVTSNSMPYIANPDSYGNQDDGGLPKRPRTGGRYCSPGKGGLDKQSSGVRYNNTIPDIKGSSEPIPPTPPAKDTPPYSRSGSPLRRVGPTLDLRKSYDADIEGNTLVDIPDLNYAVSSSPDVLPESDHDSPPKFTPYNAKTYEKLTGELPPYECSRRKSCLTKSVGESMTSRFPARGDSLNNRQVKRSDVLERRKEESLPEWLPSRGDSIRKMEEKRSGSLRQTEDELAALRFPFADSPNKTETKRGDSLKQTEGKRSAPDGNRSAPPEGSRLKRPQLPPIGTKSVDGPSSIRERKSFSPLKPHFYSPKYPPALGFRKGETPSKNTDKGRLLYIIPCESPSPKHSSGNPRTGFIPMIFQGDPKEIDPGSPTALELERLQKIAKEKDMQSDNTITKRVMQELRINDQSDPAPQSQSHGGHPAEDSCSRLTDMLHAVSPLRSQSHSDFRPHCPSAVPSPLHKAPLPMHTGRSSMPMNSSFGPVPHPLSPRTIEDHFYMTNEHLDVVGKTTWDLLESFHKQRKSSSKERHDDLTELINKRFNEVKLDLDTFKEGATHMRECMGRIDGIAAKQDHVRATLDALGDSIKEVLTSSLAEQSARIASMEADVKEMKQMIQALQKASDQKTAEDKTNQQRGINGQYNTPNKGFAGNHGSGYELGNVHDNRSMMPPMDGQGDIRLGYHNANQWVVRPGYLGRNNKEDRPAYPTNPYHYNAGYSGSYSSFNYSPGYSPGSPPDQNCMFNNHGQAK